MDAPITDCKFLLSELSELRDRVDHATRAGDLDSLLTACRTFPSLELKTELLLFAP